MASLRVFLCRECFIWHHNNATTMRKLFKSYGPIKKTKNIYHANNAVYERRMTESDQSQVRLLTSQQIRQAKNLNAFPILVD